MSIYLDPHKNYLFEKEDETVEVFTETPGYDHTPKKVEEAEEEIEEKEEEDKEYESKDDIENMEDEEDEMLKYLPYSTLNKIRFIPRLEYGTDTISEGCRECGTEDVGDVAIIDSEIEDSSRSDDEEEPSMEKELLQFNRIMNDQPIASMEGLGTATIGGFLYEAVKDLVSYLFSIAKTVLMKVLKMAYRVYKFARNVLMEATLRRERITKFWSYKLEKQLGYMDVELLNNYTVTAFSCEKWLHVAKITIGCFDMINHARMLVLDSSPKEVTNTMRRVEQEFNKIGIKVNVARNAVDISSLLDNKEHKTIEELGWTRDRMPVIMRHFEEIGKRSEEGSLNRIDKELKDLMKMVNDRAKSVDSYAQDNKKVVKEQSKQVVTQLMRIDYCYCVLKLNYMLFDELSSQLLRICDKYETALEHGVPVAQEFVD